MAKQREKLALSCTGSDCANSLHCYRPTPTMKRDGVQGACRDCGDESVDWSRIRRLDISDASFVLSALQMEFIRAKLTAMEPNQWAWNYARRKGRKKLLEGVPEFLRKHVGRPKDAFDNRRVPWPDKTPEKMNPYYYAQHATATCCRGCIETWYGIPPENPLSERAISFFAALVTRYILEHFPGLPEEGQSVPGIPRR
jgi:hypothetical protein